MALSVQNGYIVYQRGSKSPFWNKIHNQAVTASGQVPSFGSGNKEMDIQESGARLISLGQEEMKKEAALIYAATGFSIQDTEDIRTFIQKFNEVLMGKEQFKEAIVRLRTALDDKHQDKQYRSPTISSWFSSYLGTALNQNISKFTNKNMAALMEEDFSSWTAQIDAIVDKSITQAFKAMMTKMEEKEGKELYGKNSTWKALYEVSRTMANFDQYFIDMVRSKIDFSKIKDLFKDESIKLKNPKNKGIRTAVDKKLGLKKERKSRSIGGSVEEYIMSLANMLGEAIQTANYTDSRVFTSEKMKTDTATVYSYNANIDSEGIVQIILEELNKTMEDSTSLQSSVRLMEDFYKQHLSKLDDTFIVYGSTKSYSLSNSFRGFHGGGSRNLSDAISIIQQAGLSNTSTIENYIKAAYNTGAGAIYANQRAEIAENLKIALMSAAAELLFDDWVSIGAPTGGAKAIHVLQLEGIQLPSSVFLMAAGKAMISASNDMESFIKVGITLPSPIIYDEDNPVKEYHYEEVIARWNEQAAIAKNESKFNLIFLKNFKDIIMQWI